jgi:N-acetyl-anhydromuramyl-L-alanine amidase AmpD
MAIRSKTTLLVVHVTATPPSADIGVKEVRAMHKAKGWADIGYHAVIRRNGKVEPGRALDQIGAHVEGFNSISVGVSMAGGVNAKGVPENNATPEQMASLERVLREWSALYPKAKVCGHRDLSPDQDGDGMIEAGEWIKACPCFDAIPWARGKGLPAADIRGDWDKGKPGVIIPSAAPDARQVWLQKLLAKAGYAFGPIDGSVGPKTSAALKQFQTMQGLETTGVFDPKTVNRLKAMFA